MNNIKPDMNLNKFLLIVAALLATYFTFGETGNPPGASPSGASASAILPRDIRHQELIPEASANPLPADRDDAILARAYAGRESNLQVNGQGTVVRILADDVDGGRHQRFIIRLSSGQTLLVSHNIDLAPRIDSLREGDTAAFYGEYEWNPKGGVLHWTHHDPQGRHPGGWIRHGGQTYQ